MHGYIRHLLVISNRYIYKGGMVLMGLGTTDRPTYRPPMHFFVSSERAKNAVK